MADVITRFKLETTQYDSKLRDASKKLSDLAKEMSLTGKSFDKFAKDQVDVARSLGNTASGATNLKDKLRDLVGAYNQTAKAYNSLTEEQRKTDFGKAMAESLQTLQTRITQTKTELYGLGNEAKNTGGIMGQLADKFTINIDAMKLFDVGLKAVKGALDVAKDAFFANEQNLDEWGRTVKSCESIYHGFLSALNTGNIGGYLSNIDDIVNAARAAYDALDELSTFNAFNQVNRTKNQASFQEAINAYRANPTLQNRVMLNAKFSSYRGNLASRQEIEYAAYQAEIARVAAERGISAKDLSGALSGSWGNYKSLKALMPSKKVTEINGFSGIYGGGASLFGNSSTTRYVPANDAERLGEALRQLNDTELQYLQSLGAAANSTSIEIAGLEKQMLRATKSGGGGGGSTGGSTGGSGGGTATSPLLWGSVASYASQISSLRSRQQQVTNKADYANLQRLIDYIQNEIDFIQGKPGATIGAAIGGGAGTFEGGIIDIKEVEGPVKKLADGAKTVQVSWQDAASAIQSVGQAFAMIENPAAKVIGIIGQAIATIALGFAQATSKAAAGGPLAWIAAVAGGLGTMISTIAAIKQATAGSYAEGGIVPGNNHNDGLIANVSSGELILNAAQQRNVANMLYGQRAGNSTPYVNAETIVLGINNYFRRIGRGEIVTTNR